MQVPTRNLAVRWFLWKCAFINFDKAFDVPQSFCGIRKLNYTWLFYRFMFHVSMGVPPLNKHGAFMTEDEWSEMVFLCVVHVDSYASLFLFKGNTSQVSPSSLYTVHTIKRQNVQLLKIFPY